MLDLFMRFIIYLLCLFTQFCNYNRMFSPKICFKRGMFVQGKIKYREDVIDGFENMREAFYGMLNGKYTGKVVVKSVL